MEIRNLKDIPFNTIADAFLRAFADYDIHFDRMQLHAMLQRRGFCPELSFAAFENQTIVAFTFNGIGNFNGKPTAYDTGTGTIKEFRGQGLASKIFEHSIPHLQQAGISQYLLEVLQNNTPAVKVYQRQGFTITREFNCFRQTNESVCPHLKPLNSHYSVRHIDLQQTHPLPDFRDFTPSWQNSQESIDRAADTLTALGVFHNDVLVGYGVTDSASGDITQLAVDSAHRRKGIASLLLDRMRRLNRFASLKVLNTDARCTTVTQFLEACGLVCQNNQYEMIKPLA